MSTWDDGDVVELPQGDVATELEIEGVVWTRTTTMPKPPPFSEGVPVSMPGALPGQGTPDTAELPNEYQRPCVNGCEQGLVGIPPVVCPVCEGTGLWVQQVDPLIGEAGPPTSEGPLGDEEEP